MYVQDVLKNRISNVNQLKKEKVFRIKIYRLRTLNILEYEICFLKGLFTSLILNIKKSSSKFVKNPDVWINLIIFSHCQLNLKIYIFYTTTIRYYTSE